VSALESGKILGAGLDVLEYEKSSFEDLFKTEQPKFRWMRKGKRSQLPEAFEYLINAENIILTPHVAGWTTESHIKLAQTIVDKIKAKFC
jgi:D-3-phosphoglycerate dehydrogenase